VGPSRGFDPRLDPRTPILSKTIQKISFGTDNPMVTTQELSVFHTYPSYLLRRTVNLVDLQVRLELSGSNLIYNPRSYETLIGNLPSLNIKSFAIDNSGVADVALSTRQGHSIGPFDPRWIDSLSPIHSMAVCAMEGAP
jgi:hypothetical protein